MKRPIFSIEREGARWYLVTRTPLEAPEAMCLSPHLPEAGRLTAMEKKIFELLSQGKQNKEIASELSLSVRTVKFHVSNILSRAGCQDRYELFRRFGGREKSAGA